MSKDPSTEAATVPKDARPLDVNAMELVFGTPKSPKMGFTVTPDVHSITNERTGKSPVRIVCLLHLFEEVINTSSFNVLYSYLGRPMMRMRVILYVL